MTLNYWYASKQNEIFLDLDSRRATARALSVLRLALIKKHLKVRSVWIFPSLTRGHQHIVIVLRNDMDLLERLAWSLWMGNDRLRVAYVMKRALDGVRYPDLLITSKRYHRDVDSTCTCREKHKEKRITERCPAMYELLGRARSADYFSRTGKAPARRWLRISWGKVSLKNIKQWKGGIR